MLLLVFPAALNNWGFIISQCFLRAAVISDTFLLLLYNFIFFLYCDPADDLDFLIPPSTDYICICVADAPSKWNLTMRRPTTEANFCKLESENFKLTIENWKYFTLNDANDTKENCFLPNYEEANAVFTILKLKIRHWKLKIPKTFWHTIALDVSIWLQLITITIEKKTIFGKWANISFLNLPPSNVWPYFLG